MNEGARNLRDYFQTKGYFDVQVTRPGPVPATGSGARWFTTLTAAQRHKFVDLAIAGNKYFSREEIRERMGMQPAGGLLLVRPVQPVNSGP